MSDNPYILDMLGEDLKAAVLTARASAADETIMARIEATAVVVSRGGTDLQGGLSHDGAVAYLGGLEKL